MVLYPPEDNTTDNLYNKYSHTQELPHSRVGIEITKFEILVILLHASSEVGKVLVK